MQTLPLNLQNKKYIAAAVIEQNGKIFIAQRAKNDALYGKWEFPGGKVEEKETLEECLRRELFEELDIIATVGQYLCTSTFYHKDTIFDMCMFKVTTFTGTIKLKEHSASAWVSRKELSLYSFPEPDLPVVDFLQKEDITL